MPLRIQNQPPKCQLPVGQLPLIRWELLCLLRPRRREGAGAPPVMNISRSVAVHRGSCCKILFPNNRLPRPAPEHHRMLRQPGLLLQADLKHVHIKKKPNSTPSVRRFPKIGREDKTGQNIHKHWFIPKITKPILILGTSNLSRIEQVRRTDVQVVSYPGLQLSHLLKILMAYSPNPRDPGMKPTKIVISAGINDRGFAPSTNETNMKKVVNRLRDLFPESKIFIAQHRYSDKLTTSEKNTLDKLNENIVLTCSNKSNVDFIPPIPRSAFQIGPNDHIHWTATCANFTCHHYLRHLN